MKEETKQVSLQIQLDEQTAQGIYANLVIVQHSSSEFILDFVFINPGQPVAKVRSRIIMSPEHTKRLQKALSENLAHYESRFGEIKLPNMGPQFKMPVQ
jgi:hypothetical protein